MPSTTTPTTATLRHHGNSTQQRRTSLMTSITPLQSLNNVNAATTDNQQQHEQHLHLDNEVVDNTVEGHPEDVLKKVDNVDGQKDLQETQMDIKEDQLCKDYGEIFVLDPMWLNLDTKKKWKFLVIYINFNVKTCKGSFTLSESACESDFGCRWLMGKFNVLFTQNTDKDKRNLSLSVNGPKLKINWIPKTIFYFGNKDYNEPEDAVDYNNAAMTPTDMVNNNLEPANQDQPLPGSIAAASNQRSSLSSSASESANQRSSMCSSTSDKTNQRSSMCSNTSSRPPSLELGIFRNLKLSFE